MALDDTQVRRYARHILLPDVGGRGQERLLAGSVTVEVGPGRDAQLIALTYLAAAGVGTLRLLGDSAGAVTEQEVTGQIVYGVRDVGRPRIEAIRDRLGALNPDVSVEPATDGEPLAIESDGAGVASALIAGGAAAVRALWALVEERS